MNGCISKDPATGEMKHDMESCVGCWMCVMVCPYSAIAKGTSKDFDHGGNVAVRCNLCTGEEEPHCVMVCPTGAIAFVEIDCEEELEANA